MVQQRQQQLVERAEESHRLWQHRQALNLGAFHSATDLPHVFEGSLSYVQACLSAARS